MNRIAPIFPVSDLQDSLAYYEKLGFETRAYHHGGYGFATLGHIEIHLGVPPEESIPGPASAYLFVEDAEEWAHRWIAAGVAVNLPVDTEWGQHEGVVIDPDGNTIRFGSPTANR